MVNIGKMLLATGAVLCLLGAVLWLLGKVGFRGLPGDIVYRGEHGRFYFPVVTCLVLSVFLTLALWIWQWLSRR